MIKNFVISTGYLTKNCNYMTNNINYCSLKTSGYKLITVYNTTGQSSTDQQVNEMLCKL